MWECESMRMRKCESAKVRKCGSKRISAFPHFRILCIFALSYFHILTLHSAEIHAVWDHSGKGLYEGNWPKTMAVLKKANVTDLYLNVGGVDFAHYASAFLPKSLAYKTRGDQLSAALKAAEGAGVRVHAWFICFNATRNAPTTMETFRKRGWRLKGARGDLLTYLDPANPAVRAYVLAAIDELTRYPVAGIHLDFVRWGDASAKPANAAQTITQFVAEARRHVRRPKLLTTAVYGKYPNCIATVGQDWPQWLKYDIVDYVVPMDYTASAAKFRELLAQQMFPSTYARRTVIGIGVTANESKLNAQQVNQQVSFARKCGFAGQALFKLDANLEAKILPSVWR